MRDEIARDIREALRWIAFISTMFLLWEMVTDFFPPHRPPVTITVNKQPD